MKPLRTPDRRACAAFLVTCATLAAMSCQTSTPGPGALDASPLGPPAAPSQETDRDRGPPEPYSSLTVEAAAAELRRTLEDWVELIQAGDTQSVRALVASEADLRTFVQEAQLRIILNTRPDRSALLDRLVNSARDQSVRILEFGPGQGAVLSSAQRPKGPTASFDHCVLRLSYAGLVVDLDLLHPMRFPSGWKVLEIRKLDDRER